MVRNKENKLKYDREFNKKYYKKNKDKILLMNKEYRKRNLKKEKLRVWNWRENNRDKFRICSLNYNKLNRERINKYHREYYLKNRKVIRARAIARKIPLGEYCQICGSRNRLHRHHWRYDKPLMVNTLCSECHKIQHIKNFNRGLK